MAEDEKLLKEAKKLPWEERLAHKNWKVRVDANSDISALCDSISDPKDQRLKEFGPLFRKSVADSNASAQERALDALISYLKIVDTDSARFAKEICDVVVLKCLTGRPKTIEKAQAVLLLWIELEATETFLDAMEKAVKNKVSKAVVLAVDVMYQSVSQFGTKVVPPKKILKMLPELFEHQDQNVRAAAKGLTIELCRWIGKDTVKSILFEKMRDAMRKELESEVDNVAGVSKPTRKIRSEQAKELELETVADVPSGPVAESVGDGAVEQIDEYELMDPVDILGPLGKSIFWEGVKASKWSERRDAVAELTRLASAKRLATGDYVEVSRLLKKLITDVNLAVAVEAVQAAGNLARGLRKDYSSGSRGLLPLLLERFKERKPVMADAVMQTLVTMHGSGCFTLGDIVEEVRVASKSKVPSVRSQCLIWVGQCTDNSNKAIITKQYKDYVPILMESLNDGTPEVRDAAFGAVAAIAKVVGMRPLEKSLEKLDDIKRKRLTDLIGVNGSEAAAPVAGAPASSRASPLTSDDSTSNGSVVAAPRSAASLLSGRLPSQPASKKIPNGKPSSGAKKADGAVGKQAAKSNGAVESQEDSEPGNVSIEELESQFTVHFEAEIVTNLRSTVWKERLEGILNLQTKVETLENLDSLVLMLVRFLSVLPGWAEKNVQVQQKMMEIIANMSEKSPSFSKRCVVLCLTGVVERVSDIKARVQATRCLTAFCESVEPEFVVRRLLEVWKEAKNPKVVSEGLLWMVTALEDFGPGHIPVKDVIEFCKDVALQSSAAPTRNAAVKVIGALHKSCGPDIKLYFADVKPAVQTLVNAECEKNPFTGESVLPKRKTRASTAAPAGGGADSLPREDISGKLTGTLMKNFTNADWKLRQESLETVGTILQEANMRIQPTGILELLGALKARLSDSNKNLVILTLATLGNLSKALGPAFEKSLKLINLEVLKCLGDNKKLMREAAIKTLDAWLGVVPLGRLIPYVTPALLELKLCADGRKDVLEWLLKNVGPLDNQSDISLLVKAIGSGAQDKNAEVRKAAELLFAELVKTCGQDVLGKAIKSVQGPGMLVLLGLMDRYRVSGDSAGGKESSSVENSKGGPAAAAAASKTPGTRNSARGSAVRSASTSRGSVGAKVPKADAVAAALDASVQGQALLNLRDCHKEEREKPTIRRGKFEEPRDDQIQDVENDLVKFFREDVHRRLLSPDFRKQVEGVDILQRSIPENLKGLIEVFDILLRWVVLRVCESNTICLLKVLDFLQELFTGLRIDGYTMTDWEAVNIFPCLVEKAGHNIEKVREKMRELMRVLCCLYPCSKIFVYITEGLRSKNNRTRIECVEHIGFMIERYGIEVGGPGKCLNGVVALTTERDGELRKASLNTLATAYQILEEDVWKYLGKLTDIQRSLLDEKFKWKAREMDKKGLRRVADDNGSDSVEHSGESPRSRNGAPTHNLVSQNAASVQPNLSGSTLMQTASPVDWRDAIVAIETATMTEKVVEGMKIICYELEQAVGDVDGGLLDEIAQSADQLVGSLTARVASTFTAGISGSSTRACKYVLNTLMQTFQVKRLACEIRVNTLHALITELLLWLLDDRVPLLDDGSQLLKALNVLMLKILENANRTSAFVVLIDLLHPSFGIPQLGSSRAPADGVLSSQRFSDLVVKCLIKLTKVLGSTITEVDLDRLLQSIHECFQQLGLEEIRKRAGADDKPLRMVKTVLHELVKLRGTAIKGHLSMVPIDSEPPPIILAYIDLNLQTLAASRVLAPTVTGSQGHWLDSGANGPDSSPSSSAETQLKQELAAIFKKIGDKQTSTIGLYELYRITQLYPQVDIFSQLQNASLAFRTYIRDGLAQMEKSAASGRTPVPTSFVSPPPLSTSPGQLQPKAPISNSHADVTLPTSLPSTGAEDTEVAGTPLSSSDSDPLLQRRTAATQRSTEAVSTPVPESQGGTLNAIRERMRNIQAAAAGSTGSYSSYSVGSSDLVPRNFASIDLEHHQVESVSDKALSGLQARMERLKMGVVE
ncbi:unnamed protein product [Calypogeia fissa]